jgi:hypothetical protein
MLWLLFSIDSRLTLYVTIRALPLYTYPSIGSWDVREFTLQLLRHVQMALLFFK